jgi:hypothetical protein
MGKLTRRGHITGSAKSSVSSTDNNDVVRLGTVTQLLGRFNDASTFEAALFCTLGPGPGVSVCGCVHHVLGDYCCYFLPLKEIDGLDVEREAKGKG